jgi:hypothetical protein
MEQITMEQIMKEWMTKVMARMDTDKAQSKVERKANREMMAEMKAQIGGLASRMDVDEAESEAVRKADKKKEWPKIMWNEEPLEDGRAKKGGGRARNATVASGG